MIDDVDPASHLERWRLSDPQLIACTPTSTVYQVVQPDGAAAILKCLTGIGQADEALGAGLLDWYGGDGAVRLIAVSATAHLLECADGGSLVEVVRQGGDDEATGIICDVVHQLHAARLKPPPALTPLRQRFRVLLQETPDHALLREAAREAETLLASADVALPLHGDLHHGNILAGGARGWLAIDPKGLLGDPVYDLGNVFLNPVGLDHVVQAPGRIDRLADRFAAALGFERDRLLRFAFAHAGLATCWTLADGGDSTASLEVARLIAQRR